MSEIRMFGPGYPSCALFIPLLSAPTIPYVLLSTCWNDFKCNQSYYFLLVISRRQYINIRDYFRSILCFSSTFWNLIECYRNNFFLRIVSRQQQTVVSIHKHGGLVQEHLLECNRMLSKQLDSSGCFQAIVVTIYKHRGQFRSTFCFSSTFWNVMECYRCNYFLLVVSRR